MVNVKIQDQGCVLPYHQGDLVSGETDHTQVKDLKEALDECDQNVFFSGDIWKLSVDPQLNCEDVQTGIQGAPEIKEIFYILVILF